MAARIRASHGSNSSRMVRPHREPSTGELSSRSPRGRRWRVCNSRMGNPRHGCPGTNNSTSKSHNSMPWRRRRPDRAPYPRAMADRAESRGVIRAWSVSPAWDRAPREPRFARLKRRGRVPPSRRSACGVLPPASRAATPPPSRCAAWRRWRVPISVRAVRAVRWRVINPTGTPSVVRKGRPACARGRVARLG